MLKRNGILFFLWIILGIHQIHADSNVIEIKHINSKGIKIEKSGVYRFTNNIKVNLDDCRAAISIEASNVVLDLNQFTLKQKGCSNNNIGILVKPGLQSVTIKNGTIKKFHGFGIKVEEDNRILLLQDLTVTACGFNGSVLIPDNNQHTGGILFLGTSAFPIKDITLKNVNTLNNSSSTVSAAVNGLLMVEVSKVLIQMCNFSNNKGASEIAVAGAEFFRTSNCVIENSHADENSNNPLNGANASCFGFHFNETAGSPIDSTESFNIKITDSTANRTIGSVIRVVGFRFLKSRNIVIEKSESHQNTNTLPDPVNVDNTITAVAGYLLFTCDDFTIKNCCSFENTVTNPSLRLLGGFDIAQSNFGLITDCYAAHCQNSGSGLLGGFIIEPLPSRPDFPRSIGVVFENCISEGNVGNTQGGGFALFSAVGGKIINCEAIKNSPFGIHVGIATSPSNAINSIIKDNIVMSNSSVGIIDNTGNIGPTVNAYLGNIARDNPINFDLPTGNPITLWSLSTGGALVAQDNANIDIQ